MHIPRRVRRITVNPDLCIHQSNERAVLAFDSAQPLALPHAGMVCDIDIYPEGFDHAMIQVQGLECVPFSEQTMNDDREAFSTIVWDVADVDAQLIARDDSTTSDKLELAAILDRVASFYLRGLEQEIPIDHSSRTEGPLRGLLQFASHVSSLSNAGVSPFWKAEWEQDTPELIVAACEAFTDKIDMKLVSDLGKNLVAIAKGDKFALDVAIQPNLTEWSMNGVGVKTFNIYLAQILKQIVHRCPNMHILELRGEIGSATKAILDEIGPKFASYTIAAPNAECLDPEKAWIKTCKEKVIFNSSIDLEDLQGSGFSEASFDLVVASFALSATYDLEKALHNVRRLLKPGGQLVVLELLSSFSPFFGVIFGTFPRWRVRTEGALSLAVTASKWDNLLRNAGFSGVDTNTAEEFLTPFTVFTSQAMDSRISYLRDPLSPSIENLTREKSIEDLVILDGNNFETTGIANRLSTILRPYCGSLRTSHSFLDFLHVDISSKTVVLSLAGLNGSFFRQLNNAKWEALRKMFLHEGTLLWVTQGRLADNPAANMILGLLRSAARENPALDYLLLDIGDVRKLDLRVVAETILRHQAATQWTQRDDIHLTIERELVIDDAGRLLISRLMLNDEMNQRYDSTRREILRQVQPAFHNIGISSSGSGWDIKLEPTYSCQGGDDVQLRTTHSLLSPIRVAEFDFMFLLIGRGNTTGESIVSLSSRNDSLICTRRELSITIRVPVGSEARFLWLIVHHLLASIILRGLSKGDGLLVYEPTPEFASIITEQATLLGVQASFTTTHVEGSGVQDPSWLSIHPAASERTLASLVHEGFSAFIDMSPQGQTESVGGRIAAALPATCRKEKVRSLIGTTALNPTASHLEGIRSRLANAVEWASMALERLSSSIPTWVGKGCHDAKPRWEHIPAIALRSLAERGDGLEPLTVVEWVTTSEVSIKVRPVDSQVSLSGSKTYWLVGLTGGLGLSLCEWMIQRGARYFVITSRKPNVETAWLDEVRARKVHVNISAW